jgi:large subunit ribosomal protein L9
MVSSKRSVRELEHQKKLTEHRKLKLRGESQAQANLLSSVQVTIAARVGEQDKLFGSISARDISKALSDLGHNISHRSIKLAEPLKTLGQFPVDVRLQADVVTQIKVLIVPESASAQVDEIDDAEEAVFGVAPEFKPLDYY